MKRLSKWLVGPRLPLQLAGLCVLLTLPALWVGWQLDDHFHRLALSGAAAGHLAPAEVFTGTADPELNRHYVEQGILPWWTSEEFRIAFLRILSVLTSRLDYRLWPDSAVAMHAHSLAWLALLIASVTVAYRRLMGTTWTAGLAALMYALDDANAIPASWLANRSALLSAVFGVLCLVDHQRWRTGGSRGPTLRAPLWLALALLSGETALGIVGYLLAYALFLDRGARRFRALIPCGAVVTIWAAAYAGLGFGARGSGLYVDPLQDPIGFVRAVVERAPFLLAGQWWALPADLGNLGGSAAGALWWAALLLAALVAVAVVPLVRRDRTARFWCAGMLLALVPICSTFPGNRMLLFVGFGAMGLLAQFLSRFKEDGSVLCPGRRLAGMLALLWILVHLIGAPLGKPVAAYAIKWVGQQASDAVRELPSGPSTPSEHWIFVYAPDYLLFVSHQSFLRALEGHPTPRRLRALATGPAEVEVLRRDEHTLVLRSAQGWYSGGLGRLFLDDTSRDRFELSDLTVEVAARTADGRPSEIVARFSRPLDDPSHRWICWQEGRFVPFVLPARGKSVVIPAARDVFDPRFYLPRE